jgi:tetratricopeptide (TPR) repeat protein
MEYQELDRLLDQLRSAIENEDPEKGYWKALWVLVSEIREGLRDTRYPTPEEKNQAICRLDDLVKAAKSRSERDRQEREERQRVWERRQSESRQALEHIQSRVAVSAPIGELERMIGTIVLAPLIAIETVLRSALGLEQLDETQENLKSCSAALGDAWRLFTESKNDLLPGEKHDAYRQLTDAQGRLNTAWEAWRAARNQFREQKRHAWAERQRERQMKHDEFVRRVEANIDKLEGKIQKAEDALDRQKSHLAKLEDDYANAWSDSFRIAAVIGLMKRVTESMISRPPSRG